MNYDKFKKAVFLLWVYLLVSGSIYGYEIFIYRTYADKKPISREKAIHLYGEFFGQFQSPGTFPSYNDLSGAEDRWNYGFRNLIFITEKTSFLCQLVTHDDGNSRTKFDWHFSLRHLLFENLVLIIGHDSDHDSDHTSFVDGRRYYVNRNYLGFGFPLKKGNFYFEPFVWAFLPNTKHRVHLDLSGGDMRQEYGMRMGMILKARASLHFQIISQADKLFSPGQALLADLILRIKLLDWFELSAGGSLWQDLKESPLGHNKKFHKLLWGIAIPF